MKASGYNPRTEVRFAVVMYGGVSLAIYINGVAQELFRLVRATAPDEAESGLALADDRLSPLEAVYREMAKPNAAVGVETRFVVDILSGTSAGGINGILLAKAIANGLESMDELKRLWIEEGDIGELLNEPDAYKDLADFKYTKPPASLLAGDRLLDKAMKAIAAMGDRPSPAPQYADQLDLAVTMTDLQGLWLPLRLADGTVLEPRHRAVLNFAYATPKAIGLERNDFLQKHDRMLAFAARATSSFPFAFSPILLDDIAPNPSEDERRLFNDWIQMGATFGGFAFADGGYLQNKPFSHATRALSRRRADRPVTRKLLYVEPDPVPVPDDHAKPERRPDVLANTGLALVGLPSAQPIRDDIEEIEARNAAVARVEAITRDIYPELVAEGTDPPLTMSDYYLELRQADVLDGLADALERATHLPPGGQEAALGRLLLRYQAEFVTVKPEAYLHSLDLGFRLRRLVYLNRVLDQFIDRADDPDPYLAAKRVLNERYRRLRTAGRNVRARGVGTSTVLEEAAHLANVCLTHAPGVMAAESPYGAAKALVEGTEGPAIVESLGRFVAAVAEELSPTFAEDDGFDLAAAEGAVEPMAGLAETLATAHRRAVILDRVEFPLTWPHLGEAQRVDVHRISPRDAESLVPMPTIGPDGKLTGPRRLAGVSLGHFGGFLDKGWRYNDMLWGRLDGSERLISVLADPDDAAELRVRAHAAILREEFTGEGFTELMKAIEPAGRARLEELLGGERDADLVQHFADAYAGPSSLESEKTAKVAARAVSVTGGVLGGVERGNRILKKPAFWLSRVGSFAWGFLELAMPSSAFAPVLRNLPQIATLFAVVLVLAGVLGVDGAQATGFLLLGAVVLIVLVRWLLSARRE